MAETAALPSVPTTMVDTAEALQTLCRHLHDAGRFAFDTEFIGETSYRPILCLVQVATPAHVALIDPLALTDLTPLWDLLADAAIEKYCHAGEQDIAIAFAASGKAPRNVFDTQVAAGCIGLGYPLAYWRLVEHYCQITLDKAHTYSAWDRRPLSGAQFRYAVDDVRYLCAVADGLAQQLHRMRRSAWAVAASQELCNRAVETQPPQTLYTRIKGAGNLQGRPLAALRSLVAWREQLAYEHDLPPRSLIKDEVLLELSGRNPKSASDLGRVSGLPRPEFTTYGEDLATMLQAANALPPEQWPAPLSAAFPDTLEFRNITDMLWAAAQTICIGQSITPGLVTSQAHVATLARDLYLHENVDSHYLMRSWRGECLGRPLVDLYTGRRTLRAVVHQARLQVELPAAHTSASAAASGASCAASPVA